MLSINADFSLSCGSIKPMNAVNNGPKRARSDQTSGNRESYAEAGFPYARLHDSALYSDYGGHYTVDITGIFCDFNADETDPASYDFTNTDEYLERILSTGTKIFYRLGQSIEHTVRKHGTLPPPDFDKWARICEHIIRHYNEGWADGYHMDIDYWEIWNEPDLDPDDAKNKRCWGGTRAEFFDLYEKTAKHLKNCFPSLKIGGPAISGKLDWAEAFLAEMRSRQVELDFFSWHVYGFAPSKVTGRARAVRALLDKYGYTSTESILNEWNYVKDWSPNWLYSLEAEQNQKGASFATAVMASCQYEPVDMLMYYDARPGGMNGLFKLVTLEKGYTYWPYLAFSRLVKEGNAVPVATEGDIYGVAAKGDHSSLLLTYFNDDDSSPTEFVDIQLTGLKDGTPYEIRRLRGGEETVVRGRIGGGMLDISLKLDLFDILYFTTM